jgi:hypothetical protein
VSALISAGRLKYLLGIQFSLLFCVGVKLDLSSYVKDIHGDSKSLG